MTNLTKNQFLQLKKRYIKEGYKKAIMETKDWKSMYNYFNSHEIDFAQRKSRGERFATEFEELLSEVYNNIDYYIEAVNDHSSKGLKKRDRASKLKQAIATLIF